MFAPKAALIIPPVIAAAESSYQGVKSSVIGEFIVVGAAFLAILLMIWGAVEKLRGTPQKREVSFADEYATRKEHAALQAEVTKIDNERRVSVANLHAKIDANTGITAETKGKVDLIHAQLSQMNTHLLNKSNSSTR